MTGTKLDSLGDILRREREKGYQDTTVFGGLDLFLQRWPDELAPAVGELRSYSLLTPMQRESWAAEALQRLSSRDVAGQAPSLGPSESQRPTTPRGSGTGPRRSTANVSLADSVYRLKRVTPKTMPRSRLSRLGVTTVGDLVYHFPNRHIDYSNIRKVAELEPGEEQTVSVNVWEVTANRVRRSLWSIHAILGDETGNIRATWFRGGYRKPPLTYEVRPGAQLVLSGTVSVYRGSLMFESPEYELLRGQEELVHTGRLVPVYASVEGVAQKTLRSIVKQALGVGLGQVVDYLPKAVRHRTGVMGLQAAIAQAHYPDSASDRTSARRRLAFDELLTLQLGVLIRKREWQQDATGIPISADPAYLDAFTSSLPFELTGAQARCLREVLADMALARPMSRLLQGDVGSGKTAVAAGALLVAAMRGYQGAIIAPTEILAEQHFMTIAGLLSGSPGTELDGQLAFVKVEGFPRPITLGLLIGSLSRKAKDEMHRRLADGEIDLAIGTHALIQADVEMPRLALAVVDEQHRFGVMQRAALRGKGRRPHLLAMSATPIPRSLALTLYGELDISVIDELPPGRPRIRTRWVESGRRAAAYNFVSKEVEQGRQAFVVCPLIDESEAIQTAAATEEFERLSRDVFPDLRLALLHGRMALREKELIMGGFQSGDIDILVATPVVEVGIDVPNATVMLIDGAERFGLAQLHQFRGRVGRGAHQSHCLLLADSAGPDARERLRIVERVQDGFELAEEDLRLRGPGDYLGTRQSGLPELKVATVTDLELMTLARREATRILESDPDLEHEDHAALADHLEGATAGLVGERS